MSIFITSDHHFFHNNIIKYSNRPFGSVEEMNNTLIQNWNNVVGVKDEVYYLGDFALSSRELIKKLRLELNGTIYLIVGNHDRTKASMYDCGFIPLSTTNRKYDHFVLSEKPVRFPSLEPLLLTHSPYWQQRSSYIEQFGCEYNMWNLHGHVHLPQATLIDIDRRQINVNTELWNYRPASLDEIYELIFRNSYVEYRFIE